MDAFPRVGIRALGALLAAMSFLSLACSESVDEPNFLSFSKIPQAQELIRGQGTVVAVLDWQFDLRGRAGRKYITPISMVPGEEIGKLKPWHGEWMAEAIHRTAPEAKIIPIKARSIKGGSYQDYLIAGIRHAADRGAVAVTSSMGPTMASEALDEAIAYAESRGTIFVSVHPEFFREGEDSLRMCMKGECDGRVLHTGIVSVEAHPVDPDPHREIYVWPYDLDAHYEDGWGFSNGPPVVAGAIALMKSANPALTPADLRRLIVETGSMQDGFLVLDAEAAVKAALREGSAQTGVSEEAG